MTSLLLAPAINPGFAVIDPGYKALKVKVNWGQPLLQEPGSVMGPVQK